MIDIKMNLAPRPTLYGIAIVVGVLFSIYPGFMIGLTLYGGLFGLIHDPTKVPDSAFVVSGTLFCLFASIGIILLPFRDTLLRHFLALTLYFPIGAAFVSFPFLETNFGNGLSYFQSVLLLLIINLGLSIAYVETTIKLNRNSNAKIPSK